MRFKIDENLHSDAADFLSARGHPSETVESEGLRGCDDHSLALHCRQEDRAIITLDLDFADIRSYPPAGTPGIIVLRLRDQSKQSVLKVLQRVDELLAQQPLTGRLWIVSDFDVRIRES